MGSTLTPSRSSTAITNHSHVCGINFDIGISSSFSIESFPRMWDQPFLKIRQNEIFRIIPTYVGSTTGRAALRLRVANHSHVCGINPCRPYWCSVPRESFPRMWDQRSKELLIYICGRIIPTYVGSTSAGYIEKYAAANHSHVCGINASTITDLSP